MLEKLKTAAVITVGRKENLMRGSFEVLNSGVNNFNGQSVKTLSNKCLQCIIHKPMFTHSCEAIEASAADTHPKVRALACAI
jgi:predicted HicB family RNase H-like nuclease